MNADNQKKENKDNEGEKVMKQVLEIKIMTTITVLVNLGCHKKYHRPNGLNSIHTYIFRSYGDQDQGIGIVGF